MCTTSTRPTSNVFDHFLKGLISGQMVPRPEAELHHEIYGGFHRSQPVFPQPFGNLTLRWPELYIIVTLVPRSSVTVALLSTTETSTMNSSPLRLILRLNCDDHFTRTLAQSTGACSERRNFANSTVQQ